MNQDQYTVGKLFEQTGCIAQDALIQYVDGKLSKAEARKVELHLVDCPFCDAALEGIQAAGTQAFGKMMARVEERVETHLASQDDQDDKVIQFRPAVHPPVAQPKKRGFLPYLSIAASVILLAVVGFMLLGGPSSSQVADQFFQDYQPAGESRSPKMAKAPSDSVIPEAPKPAENVKFAAAKAAYQNKDYKTAAPLFDAAGTESATFQAGNCYYLSGQYDLAIQRYQAVIGTPSTWTQYAELNIAMAYLKLDRVDDAKKALEQIVAQPQHSFFKQAKEALADID